MARSIPGDRPACERPFEINTGAISGGYKTVPYLNEKFLRRIAEKGSKVVLSSDSHPADTLCFRVEEAARLAKYLGIEII